jgi:hypothetical protein
MSDVTTMDSVKKNIVTYTAPVAEVVGDYLGEVSKEKPLAYKASVANAGMFGVLTMLTALQGDFWLSMTAFACTAYQAGAALNQYNGNNETILQVKSTAKYGVATASSVARSGYGMFSSAVSSYMQQPKIADAPAVEEKDPALRTRTSFA